MLDLQQIKGIIFDYGGTIDSNGKHWSEVLWEGYISQNVGISKDQFREAYVYVERYLASHEIIKPNFTFYDLLNAKIKLQIDWLIKSGYIKNTQKSESYISEITKQCYNFTKNLINQERVILQKLHDRYPMILVSNFYGNIESVLNDFEIKNCFDHIIESAVVGIRKPNPAIFKLGIDYLNLKASEIVVIGDSFSKDIEPATVNGCATIWLKGLGWGDDKEDANADVIITNFMELKDLFKINN